MDLIYKLIPKWIWFQNEQNVLPLKRRYAFILQSTHGNLVIIFKPWLCVLFITRAAVKLVKPPEV